MLSCLVADHPIDPLYPYVWKQGTGAAAANHAAMQFQVDDQDQETGEFNPEIQGAKVGYDPSKHLSLYLSDSDLAHHCVVFGDTGTGKSRMVRHLLGEQLRAGHSLVYLDPKESSIRNMIEVCETAGVNPERIHVVSPAFPDGVPGWNPLNSSLPVGLAVSRLADLVKDLVGDWGNRLDTIFRAGLVVLSTHGYTIGDLDEFLYSEPFRESLLRRPGGTRTYQRAVAYFRNQFPDAVKADKNAIPAVLNKIEKLLESDILAEMLTARENTLDLDRFFDEQQVVLFHISPRGLSKAGAALLAGLVTGELNYLSEQPPRGNKVVLALDEIGVLKKYVEEPLADIARLSRESGLRLLVSGQELSVMTGALETVLKQANVRLFLRLNRDDAEIAARTLEGQTLPIPPEMIQDLEQRMSQPVGEEWGKFYDAEVAKMGNRSAAVTDWFSGRRADWLANVERTRTAWETAWARVRQDSSDERVAETLRSSHQYYEATKNAFEERDRQMERERDALYPDVLRAWQEKTRTWWDATLSEWDRSFTRSHWTRILQDLDPPRDGPGELVAAVKNEQPAILWATTVPDFGPTEWVRNVPWRDSSIRPASWNSLYAELREGFRTVYREEPEMEFEKSGFGYESDEGDTFDLSDDDTL